MLPFAVVMTGAAISLLPTGSKDIQITGLILQPDDGAGNPIFIGGPDVNGTTLYWWRINAPAGGVPPVPLVITHGGGTGLGQLGSIYAFGNASDILRVTVIPR